MANHRPSGQTEAWYHGYDWARSVGPYANVTCGEAMDALGIDFDSVGCLQFMDGAYWFQNCE